MRKVNEVDQPEESAAEELGLVDGLVQLSFLVQGVISRVAASYDMTPVQMRLLGILRGREPAMLELARYLNLDKSSVSGLIDRAERRGLVQRTTTPVDKRIIYVTLTPDGQRLADVGAAEVGRQINALVSGLPEGARVHLAALANQLIRSEATVRDIDRAAEKPPM